MLASYPGYGLTAYQSAIQARQDNPVPVAPKPLSTWDWARQIMAENTVKPPSKVQAAVTGLRYTGESGALGAGLGLIHGEFGLDIKGKYPVDLLGAALFALLAIKNAGEPDGYSGDLQALSQTCTSVFFFRKASEWRETVKQEKLAALGGPVAVPTAKPGGKHMPKPSAYKDPIVEASKAIAGL